MTEEKEPCPRCNGARTISRYIGRLMREVMPCPECRRPRVCDGCRGDGVLMDPQTLKYETCFWCLGKGVRRDRE